MTAIMNYATSIENLTTFTEYVHVVSDITPTPTRGSMSFQFKPMSWKWFVCLQLILAIVGIAGNLIVVIVYTRKNRLQSATNKFILALGTADLMSSVFLIPIPEHLSVPDTFWGHFYCKVIYTNNILWICIVSSIFTLTMISIERYLAVVFPIKYRNLFSKDRPLHVLIVIWVLSVIINGFTYVVAIRVPDTGMCEPHYDPLFWRGFTGTLVFLLEYFFPMAIMIFTQVATVRRLRQQSRPIGNRPGNPGQSKHRGTNTFMLRAKKKVIRMLFIVVVTFIICWSPDQFGFLIYNLGYVHYSYLYGPGYRAMVALAFTNSCANPFIYTVTNPQFRQALKELFRMREKQVFPQSGTGNNENTSQEPPPPTGIDVLEAGAGSM